MQKYLFKEVVNDDCSDTYSYYLVCDGDRLGVEVKSGNGDCEACTIEDEEENVFDFLKALADGAVSPVHIRDILQDRKTERFLNKLSCNLIKAYLNTTLH